MLLINIVLGSIYFYVFKKIGIRFAQNGKIGILFLSLQSLFVYFILFMFTFVTIELSTGEYLTENGLGTSLAPSAMIGASGYFFGRKVEGGELGEEYRHQLGEKEEELMQAKKKIAAYKRMLMRYRYNANRLGIDPTSLEAPIPPQNAEEGSHG